jgi:hypothetical protein
MRHRSQLQRALANTLFALIGSSCAAGTDPTAEALDVPLTRLRAEPVSFTLTSPLHEPERIVVRNQTEWEAYWLRLHPFQDVAAPRRDFSREFLLIAAAGDRPSSGYDIVFQSARISDGRLIVVVRSITPGPRCGVYWVLTQPVDLAVVPRTTLPIVFEEQTERSDCP